MTLLLLALAWGVLSFGAVYPWAYQPLLVVLIILGLWGLLGPNERGRRLNIGLLVGLSLLVVAVILQLVPVSHHILVTSSPAADAFLRQYELGYEGSAHSLSIEPSATRLGLALLVCLSVFLLGLTRALDGAKLRTLLPWLMFLGVVIAMIGIIQKPIFTGKIYGFWTPQVGPILYTSGGGPFGPFINRNHFAGWMLMTLPLSIGYFGALITNGLRGLRPGWRERIAWLSSRRANQTALVGFAILLMGLALVLTLSRSGIGCFMIELAIFGFVAVRHHVGRSNRVLVVTYLAVVAFLATGWVGLDVIADRFQKVEWTLEGRLFAWQDALRIFRAFPWTGTGLNTYGAAMSLYQTPQAGLHFSEAHNDYLQFLAEGGLLLVIPAIVLILIFVREVHRRFREGLDDDTGYWLRVGAVTGLIAVALQETIEFSLQMPGNAALFVVLCAISVRKPSRSRART